MDMYKAKATMSPPNKKCVKLVFPTCLNPTCPLAEEVHIHYSVYREFWGITYRRVFINLYLFINIVLLDLPNILTTLILLIFT